MSTESSGADGAAGGFGSSPAAGGGANDEIERLRARAALADQYEGTLRALEPYADDITRIANDADYREYVRTSRDVYDELGKKREPGIPPELQAVRDSILSEIKPFKEQYERQQSEAQAAYNARKQAVFDEGKPIVLAHLERHPELKQSGAFARALEAMQLEATERGKPFKEVWDTFTGGFSTGETRSAPPKQLRANAGEQGIPAASERRAPANDGKPKSFKETFLETHARVNGRAS